MHITRLMPRRQDPRNFWREEGRKRSKIFLVFGAKNQKKGYGTIFVRNTRMYWVGTYRSDYSYRYALSGSRLGDTKNTATVCFIVLLDTKNDIKDLPTLIEQRV